MKYAILIYRNEQEVAKKTQDEMQETMGAFFAYTQALREAGALLAAEALEFSSTATLISVKDGRRKVQDGPYADTKEQLGGFYLIESPNLDSALEWAARCPGTSLGSVEVRPVMVFD